MRRGTSSDLIVEGSITASSSVRATEVLIDSMRRLMAASCRTLCSWKKCSSVVRRGLVNRFQCRPSLQEIAEHQRALILEPLQSLGKVVLERTGESIGDASLIIDQAPSHLDQLLEDAHLSALRVERLKMLGVLQQELKREFCIRRIVLGTDASYGLVDTLN